MGGSKDVIRIDGVIDNNGVVTLNFPGKGYLYVAPELTCNLSKIILVIVQNIPIILIIIYY